MRLKKNGAVYVNPNIKSEEHLKKTIVVPATSKEAKEEEQRIKLQKKLITTVRSLDDYKQDFLR